MRIYSEIEKYKIKANEEISIRSFDDRKNQYFNWS